jgi:hypothetical protein
MDRLLVRGVAIAMIALLAFLTLGVALEHGVDVLVIVSFVVLAVVGIGVFGGLGSADD